MSSYRRIEGWSIRPGGVCRICGLPARIRRTQTFRLPEGGRVRVVIWDHGEDVEFTGDDWKIKTIECVQTDEIEEG